MVRLFACHFPYIVDPHKPAPGSRLLNRLFRRYSFRGKARFHGSSAADFFCYGARINSAYSWNRIFFQIFLDSSHASPTACNGAYFAHDKTRHFNAVGLFVLHVYPVISNFHSGHCNNLPEIGRICQDLLIARHRRVKYGFSDYRFFCAKGAPHKHASVFKRKNCFSVFAHN